MKVVFALFCLAGVPAAWLCRQAPKTHEKAFTPAAKGGGFTAKRPDQAVAEPQFGLGGPPGAIGEGKGGGDHIVLNPSQYDDSEVMDEAHPQSDGKPTRTTLQRSLGCVVCADGVGWVTDSYAFTLIMKNEVITIEFGLDEDWDRLTRITNDLNGRLLRITGVLKSEGASLAMELPEGGSGIHIYAIKATSWDLLERLQVPGMRIPAADARRSRGGFSPPTETAANDRRGRFMELKKSGSTKPSPGAQTVREREKLRFWNADVIDLSDHSPAAAGGPTPLMHAVGRFVVAEGVVLLDAEMGPYVLMQHLRMPLRFKGTPNPDAIGRLFQVHGKLGVRKAAGEIKFKTKKEDIVVRWYQIEDANLLPIVDLEDPRVWIPKDHAKMPVGRVSSSSRRERFGENEIPPEKSGKGKKRGAEGED